jgi:hypothetical protein
MAEMEVNLESWLSNLNGTEKQFNHQKFWIMWVGQKLNGGAIQVQMWFISNSSTVEVTQ